MEFDEKKEIEKQISQKVLEQVWGLEIIRESKSKKIDLLPKSTAGKHHQFIDGPDTILKDIEAPQKMNMNTLSNAGRMLNDVTQITDYQST